MKNSINCGKIVICWDFQRRPCLLPAHSEGACNPFSTGPAVDNIDKSEEVFDSSEQNNFSIAS